MSAMQGIENRLQHSISQLNETTAALRGQMAPTYELYQQLLKSEAERSRLAFEAEQQRAAAQAAHEDKRRIESVLADQQRRHDEEMKQKDAQLARADQRATEALEKRRWGYWKKASLVIGTIMGALLLLGYLATHFHYNPGP